MATVVCRRYVKELNETLQPRILACRNFYEYVCGGQDSKQSRSVRGQVFEEIRGAVVEYAWKAKASTPDQTPVQKAAQLFTSCARLVKERDNEVREIKKILKNSSLSWPQKPVSVNILLRAMTLSKHWHWIFPARAELTDESNGSYQKRCLVVTSSPQIPALLRMRQRIVTMGYAFNSEYAMTVAPSSVRVDVSKLVDNIRLSFDNVLKKVEWFSRTMPFLLQRADEAFGVH
ncbi:hypothetical protein IscW_ISCW008616 [Ixodes scapularis]|uniref:Peptidase M13 N-terminal domain-containing protein n=1 Tax=Ixodes scapularis TaxID=6945 RepID=B7Q0H6_IXOSC|nr:hypothetical protein IscW_ISCW008616 [Ixodes scapularis]|eukprot:XP_002407722.1 hypothetical protein IscW_ISCW008616 [Ixodes scapularis]